MNFLIVSDSFKGTFSSFDVARFLKEGIVKACPDAQVRIIPASDGGEGFLEALAAARPLVRCECKTFDLLMRPIDGVFLCDGKTAFFEAALTCGLARLSESEKNPLKTTTYGLGKQIAAVADGGCEKFVIGLGGTGTHDCGVGALQALGVSFFDAAGNLIPCGAGGGDLMKICRADLSKVPQNILQASFILAADVKNPLTGECGAARVFAPQKGADEKTVELLEKGTLHAAEILTKASGRDLLSAPGGGAAGGLGAGLSVFGNARAVSGADVILKNARYEALLSTGIDGIITGEGRADAQTAFGKLPVKTALAAKRFGIPVCLICGTAAEGSENLYDFGISRIIPLFKQNLPQEVLMRDTPDALRAAACSAVDSFRIGRD